MTDDSMTVAGTPAMLQLDDGTVHEVSGDVVAEILASEARADIALGHPELDGTTGFETVVTAWPGIHDICAVAQDPRGGRVTLGCIELAPIDADALPVYPGTSIRQ